MKSATLTIILLSALLFFIEGCAGNNPVIQDASAQSDLSDESLSQSSDLLIQKIINNLENSPYEMCPAIVVPSSVINMRAYSQLEKYFVEKVQKGTDDRFIYLDQQALFELREMCPMSEGGMSPDIQLSRQNWFELRENLPLNGKTGTLIYIIHLDRYPSRGKAAIRVSLMGADGKQIFNNIGDIEIEYCPAALSRKMDNQPVPLENLPLPAGMPEKPYQNLDALAFGLVKEMTERFKKTGLQVQDEPMARQQIRVDIDVSCYPEMSEDVAVRIQNAVRDRFLQSGLFTCYFDRKDFRTYLNKISQYSNNKIVDYSGFKDQLIKPASILLLIDVDSPQSKDFRVSMRAFWMTDPEETAWGPLMKTDMAGTYIASVFSLAYLKGNAVSFNRKALKITGMEILAPVKPGNSGLAAINDRIITGRDRLNYAYAVSVTASIKSRLLLVNVDSLGYGFRLFPTPCKTGRGFDSTLLPSVPARYPRNVSDGIHYIGLDQVRGIEEVYAVVYEDEEVPEKIWKMVLNEICAYNNERVDFPRGSSELPGALNTAGKKFVVDFERKLKAMAEEYKGRIAWEKRSFVHE